MNDSEARRVRIESIAEEYLDARLRGENPEISEIVERYPELGEDLRRRLTVVSLMQRVSRELPPVTVVGELAEIRCPHCEQRVELPRIDPGQVACPNCGDQFTVASRSEMHAPDLVAPDRLGRFEILELLGKGAFGLVYRARDPELSREVAIKVPRSGRLRGQEEVERFLREARSAARLRHPGIISVYETGSDEGIPYIVSECILGETLADSVARARPGFRQAAEWVRDLAQALAYAHGEGITHRDLKPANVILDAAGKPHVSDFGLARLEGEDVTVTLDGEILGTPAYMSPEQARGDHDQVGPSSDIYSLGVILYELLCHERPFRGSRTMLVYQVLQEEPRKPRSLNDHIPRDLETICLKAMNKDPLKRYETAADLAADLKRFLCGEAILARPVGLPERAWRWSRRRPLVAGLLGLVGLLLIAVLGVSVVLTFQAEETRRQVEGERLRMRVAEVTEKFEELDYHAALPALVEAARIDRDRPGRLALHEFRFETALARSPVLIRQWSSDLPIVDVRVSSSTPTIAVQDRRKVVVRTLGDGGDHQHIFAWRSGVRLMRFSPDGRLLAIVTEPGGFQIWRALPWGRKHQLAPSWRVRAVDFHPDGTHVMATDSLGNIGVWSLESGELVAQHRLDNSIHAAAFSPDGSRIAAGTTHGAVGMWDWVADREVFPLRQVHRPDKYIVSVFFHPDGRRLITAGRDSFLHVLDVDTGEPVIEPRNELHAITGAALSADGSQIVAHGEHSHIGVWNTDTLERSYPPLEPYLGGHFATFTENGRSIITTDVEGAVKIVHAATGRPTTPTLWHPARVSIARPSPEGRLLVTGDGQGLVRVWDLATSARGFVPLTQVGQVGHLYQVDYSPDGQHVVTGGSYRQALLFDTETGEVKQGLLHVQGVEFFTFDSRSELLATLDREEQARVWRVRDGQLLVPDLEGAGRVEHLAFSPDGDRLLTGGEDGRIRVWDPRTGDPRSPFRSHERYKVNHVDWSPRGDSVASVDSGGHLRLWHPENLEPRTPALLHGNSGSRRPLSWVQYSPRGDWVVTCGGEGTAQLWDARTGEKGLSVFHSPLISRARFSPDERFLVTLGGDRTARVWILETGELWLGELRHGGGVQETAFDPRGRFLATIGFDGQARLWDWNSGELAAPPLYSGDLGTNVSFRPDGQQLALGSQLSTALLWGLPDLPRPGRSLELLEDLATLYSVRKVHDKQGSVRAGVEELQAIWEELSVSHPGLFRSSEADRHSWHQRELIACEVEGQWRAAIRHLDRMIEREPRRRSFLIRRSRAHLELGEFGLASKDTARATLLQVMDRVKSEE